MGPFPRTRQGSEAQHVLEAEAVSMAVCADGGWKFDSRAQPLHGARQLTSLFQNMRNTNSQCSYSVMFSFLFFPVAGLGVDTQTLGRKSSQSLPRLVSCQHTRQLLRFQYLQYLCSSPCLTCVPLFQFLVFENLDCFPH